MNRIKRHNKVVATFIKLTVASVLAFSALTNWAEAGVCGRRANCVNSRDVKDNNLTAIDLKDEAGADFASGDQVFVLTGGTDVVRSVTITAPTAGQVIVNAGGTVLFNSFAAVEFLNCSITTAAAVDNTHLIQFSEATATGYVFMPLAGTRGFVVPAGSTTFNLACTGSTTVQVRDSSLTAIFVPTAY